MTEVHAGEEAASQSIEQHLYQRLSKVIDPELGRSITDMGMIVSIEAVPRAGASGDATDAYDVVVQVELTVEGCPLSETITNQIKGAVFSYPDAKLTPHIEVSSMSKEKLSNLVEGLKEARRANPFTKKGVKTRIFAIASGKGGVGKSSVTANLAVTFASMGYDTAAIDADIYGFSLPSIFGVHTQPTNLNGMLMPVTAWGVKLMSIGMFTGADRAILWRGPRLQRSLEQFLSDVLVGGPRCAAAGSRAGNRRYGDFHSPDASQRRIGGGHHAAALGFGCGRTLRPGRLAGADDRARGRREHELVRSSG